MSIAERVAWERGEVLGRSIGYQVLITIDVENNNYNSSNNNIINNSFFKIIIHLDTSMLFRQVC